MGTGASVQATREKKVVIIGGGFAGSQAARDLDSAFNVTLIDARDYSFHAFSGPRSAVKESWATHSAIPINRLIKRGQIIQAKVISFTGEAVLLDNNESVEYDYLIIATGSTTCFPGKPSLEMTKASDVNNMFRQLGSDIKESNSILVIGGGPVGIELAGQIADEYPGSKKVTLCHSGASLLHNNPQPLPESFSAKLTTQLEKMGVQVLLNARANLNRPNDGQVLKGATTVLCGSAEVEADLVIFCVGGSVNNAIVKDRPDLLNELGQIKVNKHMQIQGMERVFAVGDVNDVKENKLGYFAGLQAKVSSQNIRRLAQGKRGLKAYTPKGKPVMFVPLGAKNGASMLGGMMVGPKITRLLKGKSLFVTARWKEANQIPPPL